MNPYTLLSTQNWSASWGIALCKSYSAEILDVSAPLSHLHNSFSKSPHCFQVRSLMMPPSVSLLGCSYHFIFIVLRIHLGTSFLTSCLPSAWFDSWVNRQQNIPVCHSVPDSSSPPPAIYCICSFLGQLAGSIRCLWTMFCFPPLYCSSECASITEASPLASVAVHIL